MRFGFSLKALSQIEKPLYVLIKLMGGGVFQLRIARNIRQKWRSRSISAERARLNRRALYEIECSLVISPSLDRLTTLWLRVIISHIEKGTYELV